MCHEKACQVETDEGTTIVAVADMVHVLTHQPNETEIQNLVDEIHKIEPRITTKWLNERLQDLTFNVKNTETQLSDEENQMINEGIATKEYLMHRNRIEQAWLKEGQHLKRDLKYGWDAKRIKCLRGFLHKDDYRKIEGKNKAEKDDKAIKIMTAQFETWIKLKKKFWRTRKESIKDQINLSTILRKRPKG